MSTPFYLHGHVSIYRLALVGCITVLLLGILWLPSISGPTLVTADAARGSSSGSAGAAPARRDASIVVVVTTKASSKDRRDWLRQQFKRNVELLRQKDPAAASGVVLKFALGSRGLSDRGRNWTRAEQQEHGDLLMLDIIDVNTPDPPPDGEDTATALKVVHSAMWAVRHYNFPWFVRLGDDSYFRVDHFLLNVASTLSRTKLVFGYAGRSGVVSRRMQGGRSYRRPAC
jgi:hypothetical protein